MHTKDKQKKKDNIRFSNHFRSVTIEVDVRVTQLILDGAALPDCLSPSQLETVRNTFPKSCPEDLVCWKGDGAQRELIWCGASGNNIPRRRDYFKNCSN